VAAAAVTYTYTLKVDGSEACGGPLLPGAVPRLCALLHEMQGGDFELRCSRRPPPAPLSPSCACARHVHCMWHVRVHCMCTDVQYFSTLLSASTATRTGSTYPRPRCSPLTKTFRSATSRGQTSRCINESR
jgi:hypothetical protein